MPHLTNAQLVVVLALSAPAIMAGLIFLVGIVRGESGNF